MNIRTLALVLGSAAVVAASGVLATACSSSTSNPSGSSGGTDSGSHDGTSSGSSSGGNEGGSSSGSEGGSSSGGNDAGGPDCGSTPALYPNEAGTIYCEPAFLTDSGKGIYCPTGQQCCFGGALGGGQFAPEECAAYGSTCTNGGSGDAGGSLSNPIQIECNQISDCTANGNAGATACCLKGAKCSSGFTCTSPFGACGWPKFSNGNAIVCEGTGGGAATACAAGETQLCSSQADCPSGTTCTAGKWKLYDLGFCL
jgi:hypothetical protein